MGRNYIRASFAISLIALFGFFSALLILYSSEPRSASYHSQEVVSLAGDTPKTDEIQADSKIMLEPYDKNSEQMIGVLLRADDLDKASEILKSKGAKSKKHKVGKVIAANIPQNELESLINENIINQVLPNREVKAFSIDGVSETNAEKFWSRNYTGKGIVVAVLDTGITGYDNKIIKESDFIGSGTANDENSHGTKIAEIILAMAPDAKIINAKVLDKNGLGSEASVIAGINYAVENNADIISLSLGGLFDDINSPMVAAAEDAISSGVAVVIASGNCNVKGMCGNFTGVATPGNAPNAITVGSVDGQNAVGYSSGKDYGNYIKPDVVAPEKANSLSGTSASAPFVSGAAALIIQRYKINPLQVKSLIERNAKDLGEPGKDIVFGSGKLNLEFMNETTAEIPKEQPVVFEPEAEREASAEKNIRAFYCNLRNVSGGDTPNVTYIEIGANEALFNFSYNTVDQKDRIIVSYESNVIFDTGCLSTNTTTIQILNYSGADTKIKVEVIPNCEGGTGTYWEYSVYCPQAIPVSWDVPFLTVEQNSSLAVNLSQYSNGEVFSADGSCSVSGKQLRIAPPLNFVGLIFCNVNATKSTTTINNQVLIQVIPPGPIADLSISQSDIKINSFGNAELTVHNIGKMPAANVDAKIIEMKDNKMLGEAADNNRNIQNGSSAVFSFSMTLARGSKLIAVVDYNNELVEASEANNRAETSYMGLDVYLDLLMESQFAEKIGDYLQNEFKNYNIVGSFADAELIVNISYKIGDKKKGCSLGTVYYNGKAASDVHAGLIFTDRINGKTRANICAARIEGLVNALKRLNKEDITKNKETFFDKDDLGAIAIRDFFAKKALTADFVEQALNGPLEASENFVSTTDGTLLRLKNYKSIVSQSFLDYLYGIEALDYSWLPPVIMARGLWSNLYDWEDTAKEIAVGMDDGYIRDSIKYAPRNVWLIELTGGPGTECDTCTDYTYDDVVDKYWPALVGGAIKLAGNKWPVAYVGFSNGARSGLDALSNWSAAGKANAGKLSDGTSFNLPANAVDTYIGIGVPGAFDGTNYILELIRKNIPQANNELINQNIHHITIPDLIIRGIFGIDQKISDSDKNKISFNLWQKYTEFINSTIDNQPGLGVSLAKTLIIAGTAFKDHDGIVLVNDVNSIYSNINVKAGAGNKKVLMHILGTHGGLKQIRLPEEKVTKKAIKEFLNDDPLTHKIEGEVLG